jgi:hypothetical protein
MSEEVYMEERMDLKMEREERVTKMGETKNKRKMFRRDNIRLRLKGAAKVKLRRQQGRSKWEDCRGHNHFTRLSQPDRHKSIFHFSHSQKNNNNL